MKTLYIKIGYYRESGTDFSLSAVLETDFGAVIELWGEYYDDLQVKKAMLSVLDESINILSKMFKKNFGEIRVILDSLLKDDINENLEYLKKKVLILLDKYNINIMHVDIGFKSFGMGSRYNSLAKKAYKLRRRYPPAT